MGGKNVKTEQKIESEKGEEIYWSLQKIYIENKDKNMTD